MSLVRSIGIRDLDAVAAIYSHYVAHSLVTFDEIPPTSGAWLRRLNELAVRGLPFVVAEVDGEVLGYGYCAPWRGAKPCYRYTVEDSVYVAPGVAGRGIGRSLLAELLHRAAAAGMQQVIAVIVDTDDPASIRLHQRCGFEPVGRLVRVGYKRNRWLDTVLLQRDLVAMSACRDKSRLEY